MEVGHFTWWNADRVVERTCITGTIVDADGGAPITGAAIGAVGVDYFGVTAATSAAGGAFTSFAKAFSEVSLRTIVDVDGALVEGPERVLRTAAPGDVCTDVGTIAVSTAAGRGCITGRITDGAAGLPGTDVGLFSRRRAVVLRSGDDGAFCQSIPVGIGSDLTVSGRSGAGALVRGFVGNLRAAAAGTCGTPASCTDVGDITASVLTCVAGTVRDENGPVQNARMNIDGRRSLVGARTNVDGGYCAPVERDDLLDIVAVAPGSPTAIGELRAILTSDIAATCDTPANCEQADVVVGDLHCIAGQTTDALGAPLGDVTVTAIPGDGGVARTVGSGADGSFCVPAPSGTVDLVFNKQVGGRRFYARGLFSVNTGAGAACGGAGCDTAGEVALFESEAVGCFRGTLLTSPGQPYNDVAEALVGETAAAIRPRDDGSYCVDIIAGNITVTDPIAREGCIRPRSTSVVAPDTGLSCAAEDTCPDVGDLDFSAFCFRS